MKFLYLILFSICLITNLVASSNPKIQSDTSKAFQQKVDAMITAATNQVGVTTSYNPDYQTLKYPMGDVPMHEGVCTDVIIRAMRKIGIDLQKEVHESIKANKKAYPKKWNLLSISPDKNIDHRRVRNLVTYFRLKGMEVTKNNKDYKPGDIIVWDLQTGQWHIGLLSSEKTEDGKNFLVIHNICCGVKIENIINSYPIIAHFRLSEN